MGMGDEGHRCDVKVHHELPARSGKPGPLSSRWDMLTQRSRLVKSSVLYHRPLLKLVAVILLWMHKQLITTADIWFLNFTVLSAHN